MPLPGNFWVISFMALEGGLSDSGGRLLIFELNTQTYTAIQSFGTFTICSLLSLHGLSPILHECSWLEYCCVAHPKPLFLFSIYRTIAVYEQLHWIDSPLGTPSLHQCFCS